ncbi:O-antigen ligase family protein [candidate division WWE3 bacterium]|nr:O-antigen ligase family protein [candidate division WWE3 bacterium]
MRNIQPEKITLGLLLILIALSPLYIIRWSYFGFVPTTLLELCIWITAGWWSYTKISQPFCLKFELNKLMLLGVTLIMAGAIVSVMVADNLIAAAGIYRAYFFEPFLIFVVLADTLASFSTIPVRIGGFSYTAIEWVQKALLFTALWLSIIGISQFIFTWPIFTSHQADRAHGVYNNGNALALFIGPILSIQIIQFIRTHQVKFWPFIFVCIQIGALIMSKSSGGMIAFISTIGIIYLGTKIHKKLPQALYVIVCVTFISFLINISTFTYKTDNPWVRHGGTMQIRFCVWEGTKNLLKDHWVTGSSLSGFQQMYSQNYTTCDAEPLVYPHNWILNSWTETGILGLVGMILTIFVGLSSLGNPITPYFVYFFIHGLVDVPYFKNDLSLLFWIMIALWWWYDFQTTQKQVLEKEKN